jgi:hypothetical protein
MDSIDAADLLVKEFAVDQTDANKAINWEIEDSDFRPHKRYSTKVEHAYGRIKSWLSGAHEYRVSLEWSDLAQFVASHRRACVWAIFEGKKRIARA